MGFVRGTKGGCTVPVSWTWWRWLLLRQGEYIPKGKLSRQRLSKILGTYWAWCTTRQNTVQKASPAMLLMTVTQALFACCALGIEHSR
jgi:hypothetical protein